MNKNIFLIALLFIAGTIFTGCRDSGPDPVSVTGVNLNYSAFELAIGGTRTLIAAVVPADADNQNVTWSVNNTNVTLSATSGAQVVVTAAAVGTSVVTVTTADGGRTTTATITVTPPAGPDPGDDECDVCGEYPCVCDDNGNGEVCEYSVYLAGLRWATRNVGRPGEFAPAGDVGLMYQWGSNVAWNPGTEVFSPTHTALSAWPTNAQLENVNNRWYNGVGPCPEGWRLPTTAEWARLINVDPDYPIYVNVELHRNPLTTGDGTPIYPIQAMQLEEDGDFYMTFGEGENMLVLPLTGRRNGGGEGGWGMPAMGFYFAYPVAPFVAPPHRMYRIQFNSPPGTGGGSGNGTLHINPNDRVHGQFVRCVRD